MSHEASAFSAMLRLSDTLRLRYIQDAIDQRKCFNSSNHLRLKIIDFPIDLDLRLIHTLPDRWLDQIKLQGRRVRKRGPLFVARLMGLARDAADRLQGAVMPAKVILVVDDSDLVRDVLNRLLTSSGFDVLAASSGREGLEIVERVAGRIDAIVADVTMPGMNGPEMAQAVSNSYPAIPFVFMSGYLQQECMADQMHHSESVAFVRKPFTLDDIMTAMNSLFGLRCSKASGS